jgi:acetate kinase
MSEAIVVFNASPTSLKFGAYAVDASGHRVVVGGPGASVFTAGIGEHSASVRAALCGNLAWLGVKLHGRANTSGGLRISAPDSGVSIWVIPTNEGLMVAQHMLALVRPSLAVGDLTGRWVLRAGSQQASDHRVGWSRAASRRA